MNLEETLINLKVSPLMEQLRSLDCCVKTVTADGVVHQGHCPLSKLEAIHELLFLQARELAAETAGAHQEVGHHASFLLKLWKAASADEVKETCSCVHRLHLYKLLQSVVIMHNGFPTVDYGKLRSLV